MDKYNETFFTEDTNPAIAHEDLNKFDFADYLISEDQFTPPAYVDLYEEDVMTRDFAQKIDYHDNFNGESIENFIDSANFSLSSGPGQDQVAPIMIPVDPVLLGAGQQQEGQYLNLILNSFVSPAVPLRVIDKIKYPFEADLQVALERELERETDRQFAAALQNDIAPPAPAPAAARAPASRPTAPLKRPGNKRPDNIKNFNAGDFYEPLPILPLSWGSINPETGDQLFQYTEHGELNPSHAFSRAQISEYLAEHPLHSAYGPQNTKMSGLNLWVQTVPADSGRRYPESGSDKCRFADCPDPHRTIRKGEFRVAFDEQHDLNLMLKRHTDPFHNAGYVHLYCLEKFFDFPDMCKKFNVQPDVRTLREGRNKMAIHRDHASMEGIVWDFIASSIPWQHFGSGQRPKDYYVYTLCLRLTAEHLDKQPKHLQNKRDQRQGNSIDLHKNNLDLCVANRKKQQEQKKVAPKAALKPRSPKKRKANVAEEEHSVLDEDILGKKVDITDLSPRPVKRRKSPRRQSPVTPEDEISWATEFWGC